MDKFTQEDISPQLKLTSPLSTKRLRTDWTVKEALSENSTFDSPDPPSVQKSCLSSSNLQNPDSLDFIAKCGHFQNNIPRDKPQYDTLNLTHLTTSQSCVVEETEEVCFVSAELTVKSSITEIDKLSSYLRVDTDESPPPTNNTTSSPPNCKQLGKLCQAETPGSVGPSTENDKDGTQSNTSQLQEVPLCSNQHDCSSKDPEKHEDLCQLVKVMETNQERLESDLSNSVSLSKAKDKSPISSQPQKYLSGNMAEDRKNEKQKPEPQCCKKENLPVCEVKTKVNENDLSKTLFCSAPPCAEGSNLPNPVMLDANIAAENVSFEVDNYTGADGLSETSKLSQEPAKGDDDTEAFSVIDPAICIDAEVEGILCNTAGQELPPLEKNCNLEIALPLYSDVRTLQGEELIYQGTTQLSEYENQVGCQSRTEPQAYSVTSKETQADIKVNCQSSPNSCPSKSPPTEIGGTQQTPNTTGHQSSHLAVSPDYMETQVEHSLSEAESRAEAAGIKEGEKPTEFLKEKQMNEPWSFKQPINISETSDHMLIFDCDLKCTDGEAFSSKPDIHGIVVTTDEAEQRDGINGGKEKNTEQKNSETREIFEDDKKNPTSISSKKPDDVSEESPDERIIELVEGSSFIICNDDSEQSLGCFSHYQLSSDVFLNFPTANDAVPCQPYLEHSENPQYDSTALKCSNRSPLSALNLYNHVFRGFDTFEKIQLSPAYDNDDDAALSNMSVLTSLTGEMLKTSQQQLQHHTAKTAHDIHKSVEENEEAEEEKMEVECHMEIMTNTFVSWNSSHTDTSNSVSAPDVVKLTWPEQQPNSGSASDPSKGTHNESNPRSRSSATYPERDSPLPDLNHSFKFEMKEHFDRVLKELSRNHFANACGLKSHDKCSDVPEPLESYASEVTSEHLSCAELECNKETYAGRYFL